MSDKRRHPRFSVNGVNGHMLLATRVEIVNISLGGVALVADRRLNLGATYALRLEHAERSVDLNGTVVWSTLSGVRHLDTGESVPEYSAGLRFKDLITPALEALLEFIDANRILTEQRLTGLRFIIEAPDLALLESPESFRVRLVSRSGMLIEISQALALDQIYPLRIDLPDGNVIRGSGRVASVTEPSAAKGTGFEIGIEFMELAEGAAEKLDAFIAALAPDPP
jgi:hypothetical protein